MTRMYPPPHITCMYPPPHMTPPHMSFQKHIVSCLHLPRARHRRLTPRRLTIQKIPTYNTKDTYSRYKRNLLTLQQLKPKRDLPRSRPVSFVFLQYKRSFVFLQHKRYLLTLQKRPKKRPTNTTGDHGTRKQAVHNSH